MKKMMSGAEIIVEALIENGVSHIFGYPGGAILPFYDQLYKDDRLSHILTRHEQCAGHAAEGYARTSGKLGVMTVTSGPGATNAVTPLTDALLDSIPVLCISGQVNSHLIGTDAFQEADIIGITRSATKHNYLVKSIDKLAETIHEAIYIATTGRPGPVVVDVPKNIQSQLGVYISKKNVIPRKSYRANNDCCKEEVASAIDLISNSSRPIFYTGGGLINSGLNACKKLKELVELTGFPITSTLMGLGAFPASNNQWIGMLGMHGTYEANMAMYNSDLIICIGARFDDRVTGIAEKFAPYAKKIHVDIDSSSINKIIEIDVGIHANCYDAICEMLSQLQQKDKMPSQNIDKWWRQIKNWSSIDSLQYDKSEEQIKPQHVIEQLQELIKDKDYYITTEVGQHQMWAAQHLKFEEPFRWATSGGLGTMGYGLPAAIGAQVAHPEALVIDIAGEASIQMVIQELATAKQYNLPVKILIMNNKYMGMVRQWQELDYEGRYSQSYSSSLPDFVAIAEAYGGTGMRISKPKDLHATLKKFIENDKFTVLDCVVEKQENVLPMIKAGAAHNTMLLPKNCKLQV